MSEALTKARAAKIARAGLYAAHVAELAEANGVEVEVYQGNGRAVPRERVIRIKAVRGVVSYYVALHEIGHCVMRGRSKPTLECEALAWQWAIDRAIVKPSPAVRKMIRRALRSYHARHLRYAHRRYMRFPESGHVFWTLAEVEPPRRDYDGRPIKL